MDVRVRFARFGGRPVVTGALVGGVLVASLVQVSPIAGALTAAGDRAIFEPLRAAQLLDTRVAGNGGKFAASSTRTLVVAGRGGVAPDATAVVVNVLATGSTRSGYLTAYPSDPRPSGPTVSFTTGQTIANMVTVKLVGGNIRLYNGSTGTTHVAVHVSGYYRAHNHDDRYSLLGHNHDERYAALAHDHDARYALTSGATFVPLRGDGAAADNGAALRAAMTAIADATAEKPYVVHLAPGTYDLGATVFALKPFVSLAGSGRTATLLTSSAIGTQPGGALRLADGTEVSGLAFTNTHATSGTNVAIGMLSGAVARLTDVSVRYASPSGIAVLATTATLDIVDSTVRGEFSGTALAMSVFGFINATMRVRGSDIQLAAPSATNEGAVASQSTSVVEVENSRITSTGRIARIFTTSILRIANSRLDGLVTGAGATVCFGTYTAALLPATCSA
jgi:hypothetical protein